MLIVILPAKCGQGIQLLHQGVSLLENLAMTDDELAMFEGFMPTGGAEVFRKLSAWCKNNSNAYKHNVTFGIIGASGSVISVNNNVVEDTALALTPDTLTGFRFLITSEGDLHDQERDIVDNTENTITLDRPYGTSIKGLTYKVYNPEEKFITYALTLDLNWDVNMIQAAEIAIKEALVTFALKEWYLANRYMDDFTIEDTRYQAELIKIRSCLLQSKVPYRRPTDFIS
jgi:hypothetical protein